MRSLKSTLCIFAFFLCSCIQVKDFGKFWDKGIIDPELEGKILENVEGEEGSDYKFEKAGDYYLLKPYQNDKISDFAYKVRTLKIGEQKFLMVKDPRMDDAKFVKRMSPANLRQYLQKYEIENGIVKSYSLIDSSFCSKESGEETLYSPEIRTIEELETTSNCPLSEEQKLKNREVTDFIRENKINYCSSMPTYKIPGDEADTEKCDIIQRGQYTLYIPVLNEKVVALIGKLSEHNWAKGD